MADSALTQSTHGDGAGLGDDLETASLPSRAPTNASAMPGDLDDFDDTAEIIVMPQWGDSPRCSDGSWAIDETRGGGETSGGREAEAGQVKESGHGGNLGLLTANWGGQLDGRNITGAYAA